MYYLPLWRETLETKELLNDKKDWNIMLLTIKINSKEYVDSIKNHINDTFKQIYSIRKLHNKIAYSITLNIN
jgi:hypothetical protein